MTDLVLCDRCLDLTWPRRNCPDCAAEAQALAAESDREEVTA